MIRWESAAPVAAAMKTPMPPEFAGHYVITVSGLPRKMLEAVMPQGMEPFLGTRLSVPDGPEIPAEYVFLSSDGTTLGFAVPAKKLPLSTGDNSVDFTMICEGVRLHATFHPREMTYRRKLSL